MKDVRNRCYRLDDVEIDVQNRRVTAGSEVRPVEPKSFRLLLFLVENPGRALTKDEIMAAVWPGAFVSDNSLARAITQIRKALDDDPKAPRYIETVPTVGYRFLRDCREESNPAEPVLAPGPASALPASPPGGTGRSKRLAIGGATAFAIVGLLTGGWLLYFSRAHALTDQDTIVLADFANSTGDAVFDAALRQGLAVQLGQSPLLNILPEQKVRSALQEMTRSPDDTLSAALAREVCERTGSRAYIAGSIANLGGHYVIGLNAFDCSTGDALAREQIEAADKQLVIAALGTVAGKLRSKLGESINSIQKYDVPLAQATTPSLEALKAYSLGLSKFDSGDQAGAVPFFQRAIELDPDFAMAYANLGRAYQVLGRSAQLGEALSKAFALRHRTGDREQFDISAGYYQFVTYQIEEAIQTCELWIQNYPHAITPHRILGYENGVLGRTEASLEEFGKAKELDPTQEIPYSGLVVNYMALNRLREADALYREAETRKLHFAEVARQRYLLAFVEGDQETMAKVAASTEGQPGDEIKTLLEEALTEEYYGHLRRSQELSQRAENTALSEGDHATAADVEALAAFRDALFGNPAGARRHAADALSLGGQPDSILVPAGNSGPPAVALGLAADPLSATNLANRLASHTAPTGFANKVWLPEIRAEVERRRGDPMKAVELLAPVAAYEAGWFDNYRAAYLRGEAYLDQHRGPEAAAEFQKIIDHPGVVLNSPIGALARLGLARAYALEDDAAKASAAYQDFFALWKSADPGIPVLIAAQSEYANLK